MNAWPNEPVPPVIKILYIEYKHSNNVDTDKINDTINKIIKKILSQSK